jgi:hypothetical protein
MLSARGRSSGFSASSASTPQLPSNKPALPPEQREQHALEQHLPNQTPAAGAKRRTNRELHAVGRDASEEQISEIRAGDQQQQRDGTEEHEQRGTHTRDHALLQTDERGHALLVLVG